MARPEKKGLSYFPMDVDCYDDVKMIELLDQCGPNGVAVYQAALCMIYREGYALEISLRRFALCLCRTIGSRWIDRETIEEILKLCGELELFDPELMKTEVFTSRAIQRRYAAITARNKNHKRPYWLLEEEEDKDEVSAAETSVSVAKNRVSAAKIPAKKTKENKTKEKDTKREGEKTSPRPRTFGEHKNVELTEEEYRLLRQRVEDPEGLIENLSGYKASTGKQYQNDYATLLRWDKLDRDRARFFGRKKPFADHRSYDLQSFDSGGFEIPDFPEPAAV